MEITLKIDKRNKQAKAFLEYIKSLPFIEIENEKKSDKKEESPYNPEFVERILNSYKNDERIEVDPNDIWGSLGLK